MIFVLLLTPLFVCTCGFLLEGNTPTTNAVSSISDKHYDMLMDLLIEERHARRKQDQIINQLQKDLYNTKQEVTQKYIMWNQNNRTVEDRYITLANRTVNLENELNSTHQNYVFIRQQYFELKHSLSKEELRGTQLENENKILRDKTHQLETDINKLKQLKTISDLESVFEIWNETKHIEEEIQKTNSKLNVVISDAVARKQDFLALFSKADLTEQKLDNISLELEHRLKSAFNMYNLQQNAIASQTNKTNRLTADIHQIRNTLSNRVVLSSSASTHTAVTYGNIIFDKTLIKYGVGAENLKTFTSSGNFTFESKGVFQISLFVSTDSHHCLVYINKNGDRIASALNSITDYYATCSAVVVELFDINDYIEVQVRDTLNVLGNRESGISVIQLK